MVERFFFHSVRSWDTLRSDLSPLILARSGWVECSNAQYKKIRKGNEKQNKAVADAQKKIVKKTKVAASGKTRSGDKAKVKQHDRKLNPKQRKAAIAHELQRTAETHTDLSIETRKNSDGSISHFDRESGWELKRITANGSTLEQNDIKDLRRFNV